MPARRPADAYTLLGIEPGASRVEIRRAYRRRALEVHPDVAGEDTTAAMAALNDARDRALARAPGRRAPAQGDPSAHDTSPRPPRPDAEPTFSHTPAWDDYWSAWNDPPRRTRP
jgi:molecular chaperone DnaJ